MLLVLLSKYLDCDADLVKPVFIESCKYVTCNMTCKTMFYGFFTVKVAYGCFTSQSV